MKVSVWNVWKFIGNPRQKQIGLGALYASDGYMKSVKCIHKRVQFADKRKWRKVKKPHLNFA
jgi:hypothetical protein